MAEQAVAWHQLWRDTARQRAARAAADTPGPPRTGRPGSPGLAAAALAAFGAAVSRADPLGGLHPPG